MHHWLLFPYWVITQAIGWIGSCLVVKVSPLLLVFSTLPDTRHRLFFLFNMHDWQKADDGWLMGWDWISLSLYVNTKTAINGRMLGIIMGDETNTQWNEERQRDFHVNQLTRKEHCAIKGDIFIQARLHDLEVWRIDVPSKEEGALTNSGEKGTLEPSIRNSSLNISLIDWKSTSTAYLF